MNPWTVWNHEYRDTGKGEFVVVAWRDNPNPWAMTYYHTRGYAQTEEVAKRAVELFNADWRSTEAYALLDTDDSCE